MASFAAPPMARTDLVVLDERSGEPYDALVAELSSRFDDATVCPFLGAGISADHPANLPLAKPLVSQLVQAFQAALDVAVRATNQNGEEARRCDAIIQSARLERFLDVLHHSFGSMALEYVACLNGSSWNANHAALAALAHSGRMPACVTLNFDLLIELALDALGAGCLTECPLVRDQFSTGANAVSCRIVKPHGSFTPAGIDPDQYRHLSATLSQVGTRPSIRNSCVLRDVFHMCPCLLVVGYSDDDWDIFPLLQEHTSALDRVIWVDHTQTAEDAAEKRRSIAAGDHALCKRIIPWLNDSGVASTLLMGRASRLFEDLAARRDLLLRMPDAAWHAVPPSAAPFYPTADLQDEQTVRSLLALGGLVRHSGSLAHSLFKYLSQHPVVQRESELRWRVAFHLAHTEHTAGHLRCAIREMQTVVTTPRVDGDRSLPDHYLWLGYEYLCLAKRPDRATRARRQPRADSRAGQVATWLATIPMNLLRGRAWMRRAIRASDSQRSAIRTKARFYWADLLHSWGNLAMLCGPKIAWLLRPYFWIISKLYRRVARSSESGAEMMAGDYYWMRAFEASLLARRRIDRRVEVDSVLNSIAERNRLVQDSVQLGNTFAYRALIAFICDNDHGTASRLLDDAERTWIDTGGPMASGHRRIALFRRLIGDMGFRDALAAVLRR